MKKLFVLHVVCCMLFVANVSATAQSQAGKELLVGRWELCTKEGTAIDAPNVRQKIYTKDSYVVLEIDKSDNTTYIDFVGTTNVDSDGKLIEPIIYTDSRIKNMLSQNFKFNYRVEGDYLYLEGIGNRFNEIWRKISDWFSG